MTLNGVSLERNTCALRDTYRLARVNATLTRGGLSMNALLVVLTVDKIITSFSPPYIHVSVPIHPSPYFFAIPT